MPIKGEEISQSRVRPILLSSAGLGITFKLSYILYKASTFKSNHTLTYHLDKKRQRKQEGFISSHSELLLYKVLSTER